ncbi:MAG: ADP-ribosylglycohydrolase family protein [Anaerolineales bacterium]|nr:ADP-ribosylglycohydrolase family protein [Anaerolineales bacterium]
MTAAELKDRFQGALVGLAAGDALGAAIEFRPPGTFKPVEDMTGGGPFKLDPGQWTDDTSMALCLAASLVECRGFNPSDQMDRYLRWLNQGYLSSTGRCFDVGHTVRAALARFESSGNPFSGKTDADSAGNGSLMRLAAVPLLYFPDPEEAVRLAADSSRTTHAAPEAVDACRYLAGLIVGALQGQPKQALLSPQFSPAPGLWDQAPLCERIAEVAAGSFRSKQPEEIEASGYVAHTLEAALWALDRGSDFRSGMLLAVNLGDDADTTGAVYGQIAGALYGRKAIPPHWRGQVALRETILSLADSLYRLAVGEDASQPPPTDD